MALLWSDQSHEIQFLQNSLKPPLGGSSDGSVRWSSLNRVQNKNSVDSVSHEIGFEKALDLNRIHLMSERSLRSFLISPASPSLSLSLSQPMSNYCLLAENSYIKMVSDANALNPRPKNKCFVVRPLLPPIQFTGRL